MVRRTRHSSEWRVNLHSSGHYWGKTTGHSVALWTQLSRILERNVPRFKLAAFITSAIYAAIAGAFIAHYSGGIGPTDVSIMRSVRLVALVAAGGMGNLWGTLGVSALLTFLSYRGVFGVFDDAVFGAILVAVMLFAPEGMFRIFRLGKWKASRA